MNVKNLQLCEVGDIQYWFRKPTPHDIPNLRWALTKRRVRLPHPIEFRVVALAGIEALGEIAGDPDEAERQRKVFEESHELLEPIDENDLEIVDPVERAEELAKREEARKARQQELFPDLVSIEANLARHWSPYADLIADRNQWRDLSQVEAVRLLLVRRGDETLGRDEHEMLSFDAYETLDPEHIPVLAGFAQGLFAPDKATAGN